MPPDRETLAAIAEYTGAETYDAESAETLEEVYEGLGSRVGRDERPREVTACSSPAAPCSWPAPSAPRSSARRGCRELGVRLASDTSRALECPTSVGPRIRRRVGSAAMLLSVREVTLRFGGIVALDGSRSTSRGAPSRADRPERRRQDDGVQRDHAALHARLGRGRARRRDAAADAAARHRPPRHRADVPEHQPLPHDDGARERPRRRALARTAGGRGAGARGARRRRARASAPRSPRRRSRTGRRSASRWRAR